MDGKKRGERKGQGTGAHRHHGARPKTSSYSPKSSPDSPRSSSHSTKEWAASGDERQRGRRPKTAGNPASDEGKGQGAARGHQGARPKTSAHSSKTLLHSPETSSSHSPKHSSHSPKKKTARNGESEDGTPRQPQSAHTHSKRQESHASSYTHRRETAKSEAPPAKDQNPKAREDGQSAKTPRRMSSRGQSTESTYDLREESVKSKRQSSSQADGPRGNRSVAAELKKRASQLRLRADDSSTGGEIINTIVDRVLKYINKEDRVFSWERFNSGSAYDKTKIHAANEFDVLLVSTFKDCVYEQIPSAVPENVPKYYCALSVLNTDQLISASPNASKLFSKRNGQTWLSPKAFKEHIKQLLEEAVKNRETRQPMSLRLKDIRLEEESDSSPAITLQAVRPDGHAYSIDLVPALESDWPYHASTWISKWLRGDVINKCRKRCFLVPKPHHSEKARKSPILWRYGFNHAEKEIILRADGGHSEKEETSTCRKDVLRLLKDDFENTFPNKPVDLCSYQIKTTMLHMYERFPSHEDWNVQNGHGERLVHRYKDALEFLIESLQNKFIEHYFFRGENLLDEKRMFKGPQSKSQLSKFLRELETCRARYQDE